MAEHIKEKPEVRYSFWNGKPVTFRPATFDDYEAVMEISQDLLLGFDYLPHAYYNYLHNPRAEAWLLELEGQVVCFRVYEVLEHDHCIVGSALRLHPELRGSGIYTFFDYVHKEIMLQKYPNLTHVLGLVAKNRLHDKMLVHGHLTLLEERESIAFQVQVGRHIFVDRLQKKSKSLKSHDVVLLSKKEVVQMLTDDKIKAGLFGSGFIVGGEHFGSPVPTTLIFQVKMDRHRLLDKLEEKNKSIKLDDTQLLDQKEIIPILTDNKTRTALFESGFIIGGEHFGTPASVNKTNIGELSMTHKVCVTWSKDSGVPKSISTCNTFLTAPCVYALIIFYGDHLQDLTAHIATQLRNAAIQQPFAFEVQMSQGLDSQQVVEMLKHEGVEHVDKLHIQWLKVPFSEQKYKL